MDGPIEPREPSRLRISDDDRHKVAEVLRRAAGDGRIDFDELDERLEATYAARTYADLVPITVDLPEVGAAVPAATPERVRSSPVTAGADSARHVAIMSGFDRKGVWTVPTRMTVVAVMGGANIDLREATFAAHEVVITVNAVMGGAEIIVNPHTEVIVEGTGIMGGYAGPSRKVEAELDHDSPVVRVRGIAFWGGVSVERREMPDDEPPRRMWRHH